MRLYFPLERERDDLRLGDRLMVRGLPGGSGGLFPRPWYADFGGAPGGKGGKSSSLIFFGDSNLKLPNLSKTTCPGLIIGCFVIGGAFNLNFDCSINESFLGRGSLRAIAFRMLIAFSSDVIGGGGLGPLSS